MPAGESRPARSRRMLPTFVRRLPRLRRSAPRRLRRLRVGGLKIYHPPFWQSWPETDFLAALPTPFSHEHRPGCPLMHLVHRERLCVRCGGTQLAAGRRSRQPHAIRIGHNLPRPACNRRDCRFAPTSSRAAAVVLQAERGHPWFTLSECLFFSV